MTSRKTATVLSMFAAAGLATSAYARPDFPEVEPNETKAQALTNGVITLVAGDSVSGTTTGTSTTVAGPASADTFLLKTGALPLGIYRHRLVITTPGTAGHTGILLGLTQTAATAGTWPGPVGTPTATDTNLQSSLATTTPARMNQWYGFGRGEQVYYRVTGGTTTTATYTATLATDPVVATVLPMTFEAGPITIQCAGVVTTDSDFWIYDSNLVAIPGYGDDDKSVNSGGGVNTGTPGFMRRTFAPGTYYLALSNFQSGNNLASPCDDNFRTGALMDFPDGHFNSSSTANVLLNFGVSDSNGGLLFAATRLAAFDVLWFKFTVGTGVTGACCLPDGSCTALSATGCSARGGTYAGDGVACGPCAPTGACCRFDGTCVYGFASTCTSQVGVYAGDGVTCAAANCLPANVGACCLPDGSCVRFTLAQCTSQTGVYKGDGTKCATDNCFASPVLWDNGPLGTGTTAGNGTVAPAGFQWSECSNDGTTSCGNTSAGFTCTQATFRMADDFTVTSPGGWNVDKIVCYAYVSGSAATTSPFAAAGGTLRIWNGRPGDSTSTVVFGDDTTNRLGPSADPQMYRVFSTTTPPPGTATGTTRRIWGLEFTVGTVLPAGNYWVDFGTSAAAFAPTNTHKGIRGSYITNAMQLNIVLNGLWADAIDTGNPAACADIWHDMPFEVRGTAIGQSCYANCDNSTAAPCLNVNDFQCFINEYAAASPYANCDQSTAPPILNVNDFQCYLNAYAASCTNPCAAH